MFHTASVSTLAVMELGHEVVDMSE
jgi:hypothetical protein